MWTSIRTLALMAVLLGTGCNHKDKSAKFMHSKDHHSPASQQRFVMAQKLEAEGNLEMAKQLYALVVADYPDHPIATRRLEAVLIATGEWNMHAPRTPPRFHVEQQPAVAVAANKVNVAQAESPKQSPTIQSISRSAATGRESTDGREEAQATDSDSTATAFLAAADESNANLGEIEASLRDFEQSESATNARARIQPVSAVVSTVTPAVLSGHIEFVD